MIDVHAHVVPAAYMALLKARGVVLPGLPPPPPGAPPSLPMAPITDSASDLVTRLRLMDEAGVDRQILTPTAPPYFQEEAVAIEAARLANDCLAATVAKHPDRLRAFASLPLPHVGASLGELTRALDELGMAGVILNCFCGDRSVADAHFEPIYAELNRRRAVLFLHPAVNGLCSRFITDWKLTAAAGPTLEDVVITLNLIVAGIPARYPDLQIVIAHLGGSLPSIVQRLDNQLPFFVSLPEAPSRSVKRLWFDTCCHGSGPAMRAAVEVFGADRIVPGSDYPFLTVHEPYARNMNFVRELGLPTGMAEAILHENAKRLFSALPEIAAPRVAGALHGSRA
jgi:predicted TIM-barrel fold metal-dependent hydrolase